MEKYLSVLCFNSINEKDKYIYSLTKIVEDVFFGELVHAHSIQKNGLIFYIKFTN